MFELGVPHGHQTRLMRALFRRERSKYLPDGAIALLTEEDALRLAWTSKRHEDRAFWNNPHTPIDLLVRLLPNRLVIAPPHRHGEPLSKEQLEALSRKRTTQHLWNLGPRTKEQSAAVVKVLQRADPQRIPGFLWHLTTADAQTLATKLVPGVHFTAVLFTELQAAREAVDHPFYAASRCTWLSDSIDHVARVINGLPRLTEGQLRQAEACLTGAVDRTLWLPGLALNPNGNAVLADRWRSHTQALSCLPVRRLAALFDVEPRAANALMATAYLNRDFLSALLHHGLLPPEAIDTLPVEQLLTLARDPAVRSAWPTPTPARGP